MADQINRQTGNQSEIKGNQPNQTIQHEQAKSEVSGGDRKPEHDVTGEERKDKSAIGGGEKGQSGNQSSDKFSDEIKTEEKSNEPTGQGR